MSEYLTSLVGVSFRPADAKARVRELEIGEQLVLEAEPENPHDSNAVRVLTEDEVFIGYIPRTENFEIATHLANGDEYTAEVTSFASELKPFFSVTFSD